MRINGKINKTTVALVIWAYDSGTHSKGDIVSQHRTMEAAQRKASGENMWAVAYASDCETK